MIGNGFRFGRPALPLAAGEAGFHGACRAASRTARGVSDFREQPVFPELWNLKSGCWLFAQGIAAERPEARPGV
jgi:hypothetical protein